MAGHRATIRWSHDGGDFAKGTYSRVHTWSFDGGISVPASSSPSVVPRPYSSDSAVDPEEAYVAAIASCHMLSFLYVASKAGFVVSSYEDEAVGTMKKNERGVAWVAVVTLNPKIVYAGDKRPSPEQEAELHHKAHDGCFISQSVKTEVKVAGFA